MQKGDKQKQRILAEAEARFCRVGYQATSVQDILTALNISKGAFYHHFPSKEAVLTAICEAHAARAAERLQEALQTLTAPIDRLSAALSAVVPFGVEEPSFLAVVLPLLFSAEGRIFCDVYCTALQEAVSPLLSRVLQECAAAEVILPLPGEDAAGLLLTLVNRCWLSAAQQTVSFLSKPESPEPRFVLDHLTLCREAVTRLLDAPYGAVQLLDLQTWEKASVAVRHADPLRTAMPAH